MYIKLNVNEFALVL